MSGTVHLVTNAEELLDALARAQGGDRIELAAGDYGALSLRGDRMPLDFDAPVTITSADPDAQASFSKLHIQEASNITFDNVVFDYQFSDGDAAWLRPFIIRDSDSIVIRNSTFLGDVEGGSAQDPDGYGYAYGLGVTSSTDITIEGNEFKTWWKGAIFDQVEGLVVAGNELHDIREDGMNFIQVQSVFIEDNHLHNFRAAPDDTGHRDFIQFWTAESHENPSADIVIRENILDIGEGSWAQAIFMRNGAVDQGHAGEEMFYRNILIEDNVIYNGHVHGITVGETDGLIIRNNALINVDDASGNVGAMTPQINVRSESTSVVIEQNITSAINGYGEQADWHVAGNAFVQPEDYIKHFITSSLDSVGGAHNYVILPGGMIEQLGAGPARIYLDDAPETVVPHFQVASSATDSHGLVFDAGLTMGPLGQITAEDAAFIWTFGDGTTATGPRVQHSFRDPGHYEVTLQVTLDDGTSAIAHYQVGIAGDDIVAFDAQSGLFQALGYGEATLLEGSAKSLVQTEDGMALKLGGEGVKASVSKSALSPFFGTDNFEISMTLQADPGGEPWGEVARIHTSFTISVDQAGNLRLELFPEDGSRPRIVSEGVVLNDGAAHDITIRFDGAVGEAQILIDGALAGSATVTGALGGGSRDLTFGNPWGTKGFDGVLTAFELSAAQPDYPIYMDSIDEFQDSTIIAEEPIAAPEPEDSETVPAEEKPEAITEDDPVVADEEAEETAPIPGEEDLIEAEEPAAEENSSEETTSDHTGGHSAGEGETIEEPAPTPEESTEPAAGDDAQPEDEAALEDAAMPRLEGYTLDIDALAGRGRSTLRDDAHVVSTDSGSAIRLDGDGDYVRLGRLQEFEQSQRIGFSIDFTPVEGGSDGASLVWNNMKLGLTLRDEGIDVQIGTANEGFKSFLVGDLGLGAPEQHRVTVLVDAEADRLQIIVNDDLVLDERNTDFDFVGGRDWGWTLGTELSSWFEGDLYDFRISDSFDFQELPVQEEAALLA